MDQDTDAPKQSKLIEVAKLTAVSSLTEIVLFIVGTAILGVAYSTGLHMLGVVVVVPIAFYAFRKWIKDED